MSYLDRHILESLIYLPMLTAVVLMAVPRERQRMVRWMAVLSGGLLLVGSLYVFTSFDHSAGAAVFQFERTYVWLEQLGIDFRLGVDGIAAPMVLLTGVIIFTGSIVSWSVSKNNKSFFILLYLLVTGVYGTFISVDLFFFFFFYELAVVPMYLLIGVWGSSTKFPTFTRTKEYAAMKLMIYLVAGSVLVLVGIIAIYVAADVGTFNILALQEAGQNGTLTPGFQRIVFPLIMIGFGVLAGLWPFHTWSPDGHVAAPTAVSMLHAGVLMKLGAFGIIRVGMMLLPEGMDDWALVLFILATINVLYGAASAMAQQDLKYIIGYSSVSHMGYVLMGIATLEPLGVSGATLQMFSHGVMTALFFAVAGAIYDRAHVRDVNVLNGLARRMGWTTTFFVIAGLTSLGLPGLSGFIAEVLVFMGAFRTEPVLAVFGVLGAAVTAVYILRLLARVFFGPMAERWQRLPDLTRKEGFACAMLAFPLLFVGVYPLPFLRIIDPGVASLLSVFPGG
jgi:NADH-quinone oxidoreductase subunit M